MKTNRQSLYLGCTRYRHAQIGVNAIINARAGRQDLNDVTQEDTELMRDAIKIREKIARRVAIHQFNSRFLRRNRHRVEHLLSDWND